LRITKKFQTTRILPFDNAGDSGFTDEELKQANNQIREWEFPEKFFKKEEMAPAVAEKTEKKKIDWDPDGVKMMDEQCMKEGYLIETPSEPMQNYEGMIEEQDKDVPYYQEHFVNQGTSTISLSSFFFFFSFFL
jgi:hypothetical protein